MPQTMKRTVSFGTSRVPLRAPSPVTRSCKSKMKKSMMLFALIHARKLDALDQKYDAQFKIVFDAIRGLMIPVESAPEKGIEFEPRKPHPAGRLRA